MKPPIICLDGPAASGKTTVARALAERLGFFYLDTGVLYRAVTWQALEHGIAPSDAERLAEIARTATIEVTAAPPGDPRQTIVTANGTDVSLAIRSPQVDAYVSEVSAHRSVREALIDLQRSMAASGGVIMAGRDMGTVVCPHAEVKIFLDASEEERAKRRQRQAAEQGTQLDLDLVLAEVRRRDRYDSSREVAPLLAAGDAVIIDSTGMTVDEVVAAVLDVMGRVGGSASDPGSGDQE